LLYKKYSECMSVALVIEYIKCMRCVILSSVACVIVPGVPTFSPQRQSFGEKISEQIMRLVTLAVYLSETFLLLRRIHRDIVTNVHRYPCKVPVTVVRL